MADKRDGRQAENAGLARISAKRLGMPNNAAEGSPPVTGKAN